MYTECENNLTLASIHDENNSQETQSSMNDTDEIVDADGKCIDVDVCIDEKFKLELENTFNTKDNYKDALLASLYSQVEFLRELEGKDLLIRSLIIKDSDVYNYSINADRTISSSLPYSDDESIKTSEPSQELDDDASFKDLYEQYVIGVEVKLNKN